MISTPSDGKPASQFHQRRMVSSVERSAKEDRLNTTRGNCS